MAEVFDGLGDWLATSSEIDWDPALEHLAGEVAGLAREFAGEHVDTGEFLASIQTEVDHGSPSGRDRLIFSDHPAAAAIEYGHVDDAGVWVPGLHVFGRAADAAGS